MIAIRRRLGQLAKTHGVRVKLSYAKVGEFQRRGLIHFHAIFRLDGLDPVHPERTVPPDPAFTADVLAEVIRQVAAVTRFATASHPAQPNGWDIAWGTQVDPRVVQLTGDGQVTDTAVASYLAKYATKSTEAVGPLAVRITVGNLRLYGNPASHQGRLILAAWQLGGHPHPDFQALRRWAHMLGYRGHFATKSRRYSTTMRALRAARRDWKRRRPLATHQGNDRTIITLTDLEWAGRGGAPQAMRSSHFPPPLVSVTTTALRATRPEPLDPKGQPAMEKLLYRPKEAARALGIGRATVYSLMRSGRLRSVKDGGMRFITLDALRDYVRQLEDQADEVA